MKNKLHLDFAQIKGNFVVYSVNCSVKVKYVQCEVNKAKYTCKMIKDLVLKFKRIEKCLVVEYYTK